MDKKIPTTPLKKFFFHALIKKHIIFSFFKNLEVFRKTSFLYEKTHTHGFYLICINNTIVIYSSNHEVIMVPALAETRRIYNEIQVQYFPCTARYIAPAILLFTLTYLLYFNYHDPRRFFTHV